MCAKRISTFGGGPRESSIKFTIDASQFESLVKVMPDIMNQEFNRGLKNAMSRFMKIFSKQAFGKGKINVRRNARFKRRKGSITIPVASQKFGFVGRMHGTGSLQGKAAVVRNSAPFALSHELGATIRPKKGKFLKIPIKSVAEARRRGVDIPKGQKPKFLLVKKVKIKPRLRFHRTFRLFRNEAVRRLNKSLARAAKRSIDRAARAKSKAKGKK